MKYIIWSFVSLLVGHACGDHYHSFSLGLLVAFSSVSLGYWIAFRGTKFPQLALFLLICAGLSKLLVTSFGVIISAKSGYLNSPFIFSMAYLFYSILFAYMWFSYRDNEMNNKRTRSFWPHQ